MNCGGAPTSQEPISRRKRRGQVSARRSNQRHADLEHRSGRKPIRGLAPQRVLAVKTQPTRIQPGSMVTGLAVEPGQGFQRETAASFCRGRSNSNGWLAPKPVPGRIPLSRALFVPWRCAGCQPAPERQVYRRGRRHDPQDVQGWRSTFRYRRRHRAQRVVCSRSCEGASPDQVSREEKWRRKGRNSTFRSSPRADGGRRAPSECAPAEAGRARAARGSTSTQCRGSFYSRLRGGNRLWPDNSGTSAP